MANSSYVNNALNNTNKLAGFDVHGFIRIQAVKYQQKDHPMTNYVAGIGIYSTSPYDVLPISFHCGGVFIGKATVLTSGIVAVVFQSS